MDLQTRSVAKRITMAGGRRPNQTTWLDAARCGPHGVRWRIGIVIATLLCGVGQPFARVTASVHGAKRTHHISPLSASARARAARHSAYSIHGTTYITSGTDRSVSYIRGRVARRGATHSSTTLIALSATSTSNRTAGIGHAGDAGKAASMPVMVIIGPVIGLVIAMLVATFAPCFKDPDIKINEQINQINRVNSITPRLTVEHIANETQGTARLRQICDRAIGATKEGGHGGWRHTTAVRSQMDDDLQSVDTLTSDGKTPAAGHYGVASSKERASTGYTSVEKGSVSTSSEIVLEAAPTKHPSRLASDRLSLTSAGSYSTSSHGRSSRQSGTPRSQDALEVIDVTDGELEVDTTRVSTNNAPSSVSTSRCGSLRTRAADQDATPDAIIAGKESPAVSAAKVRRHLFEARDPAQTQAGAKACTSANI